MTADEVAAMEKEKGGENGSPDMKKLDAPASSTKRKAGSDDSDETPVKKPKLASESADEDDDGDGEDD